MHFWHHFDSGPPNGPLYRQSEEKCNFWHHFDSGPPIGPLCRQSEEKCNFWDTLTVGHQMVHYTSRVRKSILPLNGPLYSLIVEIASVWPHFTTGPTKGPPYRLIVEMATFWSHFVNGPHSAFRLTGEKFLDLIQS